jgi:hypothetical protein
VPSTPQALNMRLSDPESSSTASILTPMTNRPLASGSGPRLPFTGSFKGAPLAPSSGGGSSSISGSKSRGLREEAKTSSARYHQRASGIQRQIPPIKKSPSAASPVPPPNTLSFAQKLRVWVFKYYGKSAERNDLVSGSRYRRDVLVDSEITQRSGSIGKRARTENLEHGTLAHTARMPGRA